MDAISLVDVERAMQKISSWIKRTPLIRHSLLSQIFNTNIYLKLEILQETGAFKVRGAFNKLLSLSEEQRQRGVVAVSAGNHGKAVAFAAQKLGIKCILLMPENTSPGSIAAAKEYGAEVILTTDLQQGFARAKEYEQQGKIFVHPYDDPVVVAGQGTLGLEILEDLPETTDVIVSIGGGGLISGIATAVKAKKSQVKIWGVQTEGANAMAAALAAGHVITLEKITSIAKTLGAYTVAENNFNTVKKYVESVSVVSDAATYQALKLLLEQAKVLTEPAASCTLAAVEKLREHFSSQSHVVLVLCGGNVTLKELQEWEKNTGSGLTY